MIRGTYTFPRESDASNMELFIGVINLAEAVDRRKFFESGWSEHVGSTLLGAKPHFLVVDRDPEGGLIGCTRSHLACYKKACEQNAEICLVPYLALNTQPLF